jgi:hypothetical protein
MSKIILKLGFVLSICVFVVIISSMSLVSNSNEKGNNIWTQDSIKAINNYKIDLLKDETIEFNISDWDYYYSSKSADFKLGAQQKITSDEYNFKFNYLQLFKDEKLECPEELNLLNPKSNSTDLKSLMEFAFSKYNLLGGYSLGSWWRYFVSTKETLNPWNDEDPNQYYMEKDENGVWKDDRMMGIFHDLMKSKLAREIIYESIKQNYKLINNKISVVQKRLLLLDVNTMVLFCENYSTNRKKYLNGRNSVTEKIGDYSAIDEYGLNTSSTEGFFFRRIEYDAVPPLELVSFLKALKSEIISSISTSDYDSNMSTVINSNELKINSHANSKNKMGFLFRTNNNSFFIECNSMKLTKLVIKGKIFWRIVLNNGIDFITLDERLNKI